MNVLVIEDGADATTNLREILAFEGCGVIAVRTVREAAEHPDWSQVGAVLVDGCPADGAADALLPDLREIAPDASAFVITGHADLVAALAALRDRVETASVGRSTPPNPAAGRTSIAHWCLRACIPSRASPPASPERFAGVHACAIRRNRVAHDCQARRGRVFC